jgi:hypothetical protein
MTIANPISNVTTAIITISGMNTSSQLHAIKPNSLASTNISVSSNNKLYMLNCLRVLFDLVNAQVAPRFVGTVGFIYRYDWERLIATFTETFNIVLVSRDG